MSYKKDTFLCPVFFVLFSLMSINAFSSKKDNLNDEQNINNKNIENKSTQEEETLLLLAIDELIQDLEEKPQEENPHEKQDKKNGMQEEKPSKSVKKMQEKIGQTLGTFSSYSFPAIKKNIDENSIKRKFSLNSIYVFDPNGIEPENQHKKKKRMFVKRLLDTPKNDSGESSRSNNNQNITQNQSSSSSSNDNNLKITVIEEDLETLLQNALNE